MATTIPTYVRLADEDVEMGEYLGDLPLASCHQFAREFIAGAPWFKGDGWGSGGGHFTFENDGWRFEIVLDKSA